MHLLQPISIITFPVLSDDLVSLLFVVSCLAAVHVFLQQVSCAVINKEYLILSCLILFLGAQNLYAE